MSFHIDWESEINNSDIVTEKTELACQIMSLSFCLSISLYDRHKLIKLHAITVEIHMYIA